MPESGCLELGIAMTRKRAMLSRRQCLATSGIVVGGLAFSAGLRDSKAGLDDAKGIPRPRRARLSFNENPFGPAPSALAAIRDEFSRICRYVDEPDDVLTRAIVAREVVSPDQIVLGEILEALGFRMATDGPSGGEFIYCTPGYTALVDAAAPGGGVAVGVPLNQTLQNDLPAIAAKTNARTRAIYLVNPHSPTGTVSDTATFLDFVREMSKRTTVIVDEAYLEFEPDFAQRTAAGLTRAGENVVVFRTFGKLYALAGMAVGYAIAPRAIAASMKRAGIGGPGMLGRLALAAAAASLRDDDYVQSTRATVTAEREKWHELFDTLKLRHADSRANFVFFETGRPLQEVAAALGANGIDIGEASPNFDNWASISIGLPHENAMARAAITELLR
jgi:histidinol-phosphate aminotransferase